jgi:DNA-directed RNA polymerase specialized sigma24 family protein
MKVAITVKKVLEKINKFLTREKRQKLAQLDRHVAKENFLNESFEEEIEENLQNEQAEARLALMLATAPAAERTCLLLHLGPGLTVSVVSGCQRAGPQHR